MRQLRASRDLRVPSISQRLNADPSAVFSTNSTRTHTGPAFAAAPGGKLQTIATRAKSARTRPDVRTAEGPVPSVGPLVSDTILRKIIGATLAPCAACKGREP